MSREAAMAITIDDLVVGDLLGAGSFASVYCVKPKDPSSCSLGKISLCMQADESLSECEYDLTVRSSSETSQHGFQRRFALKRLSDDLCSDPAKCAVATAGFRVEADLLARLPKHDNIILMQGISKGFCEHPESGFLILERLQETLDHKLCRWRIRKLTEKTSWLLATAKRAFPHERKHEAREQRDRITHVGLGIARAMAHLHRHKILYRDLKPNNVGFDAAGNIKLFDFGLSRRYKKENAQELLTLYVGSLRYMSPEMARGQPYGFEADVHSFAILLWEVLTLKKAFSTARTPQQLTKLAFLGSHRPSLKRIVSPDIKGILKSCWSPNPKLRPSFAPVVNVLEGPKTHKKKAPEVVY